MLWIECVSPRDSYVEDPTSSVTIFGTKTFTGVIEVKWGRKGEPRSNKTSVLKRRQKSSLALSAHISVRKAHVRTQRRQPSTTQRENSHQTPPPLGLTLDSEYSQLWENKFLSFEPPPSGLLLWHPEQTNPGAFRFGKGWKESCRDPLFAPEGFSS